MALREDLNLRLPCRNERQRQAALQKLPARNEEGLQLSLDQTLHRCASVENLLIRGVFVPRFHLGNQPSVITHLRYCRADRLPVVVSQEDVCIDAFMPAAATMFHHIFQVNARDARAMHLNPLLGKTCVMNIADIQMDTDPRVVYIVEKSVKFPRTQQKPLLRIA